MQGDRHDRRRNAFRARLLAGAALAACAPLATPVLAQTTAPAVQVATPSDDLAPNAVYVDADNAQRIGDTIVVSGTPENRAYVRTRGHVLRGESLSYDLNAGSAKGQGDVEAIAPNGTVVYASQLELDQNLTTGVAVDFATRLPNGASLMAATAVRRSENVNELNYARFTPCPPVRRQRPAPAHDLDPGGACGSGRAASRHPVSERRLLHRPAAGLLHALLRPPRSLGRPGVPASWSRSSTSMKAVAFRWRFRISTSSRPPRTG